MANKLYEEEDIRAIAEEIRQNDPRLDNSTFTVAEMPRAIESVADYQYEAGEYAGYQSGYSAGLAEGSNETGSSSLEMPIIRFIGLRGNNFLSNLDGEEQSVQFAVGIIAGSLQVGDTLQICGMRTFSPSEKNPIKKRKLRRFAEYEITESDLNTKSLTLTVYPTKNVFAFLGHNNRQGGGPCDYFFRIRRPVGDLQTNDSGMTVDAKFSNVVPVSMLNIVTDIQEDDEGNKFEGLKINVV